MKRIKFTIVESPESRSPILIDRPLALELTGVPLGAVLQAIEDVTGNVRFVLRDYGFVATSKDSPLAARAVSAVEHWRKGLPPAEVQEPAEKK